VVESEIEQRENSSNVRIGSNATSDITMRKVIDRAPQRLIWPDPM
jgi:hypothetical protein